MSTPTLKGPSPETAEHILNSAAQVFAQLGYARATIADIATAAKSTRPTVYAYYSSKEDIFRQLAQRLRQQFASAQKVPEELPPDEIIRLTDLNYLRSFTDNLGLLTIIQHQSLGDPSMSDLWEALHSGINATHVRFMDRLVKADRAAPAASLASIADAVNGLVMRFAQLIAADPTRFDELGDDLVALHLRMLGLKA
ncbi:MAG TPA: TetR/AcrR family transcriptional regulator [Nocardioides sp.]